jgi:hypothetical protein
MRAGGFATVYLGQDSKGESVAIKRIDLQSRLVLPMSDSGADSAGIIRRG